MADVGNGAEDENWLAQEAEARSAMGCGRGDDTPQL